MKNDGIKLGTTFTNLTIVKIYKNNQFVCRCLCGKLVNTNEESLKNSKKIMCDDCFKRKEEIKNSNIVLRNNRIRKELYYIWVSYKELYKNPSSKFKKQIINKNIKFFPELEDNFKLFSQWALLNHYQEGGNVFLDRKNKDKDFSVSNCFWNNDKKNAFVILPSRNIDKSKPIDDTFDTLAYNMKILEESGTTKDSLTKERLEIQKNERKTDVKQDKEKLVKYLKTRYNIDKLSFPVNELILHLNSGVKMTNFIVPIKIEYARLLEMMKNYETIFTKNHKNTKTTFPDDNKRLYYDLITLINDLDVYEEKLKAEKEEMLRLELEEQIKFNEEE